MLARRLMLQSPHSYGRVVFQPTIYNEATQ